MTTPIKPIYVRRDGSFAIPAIGYKDTIHLAAGTSQTVNVPVDAGTSKPAQTAFFKATTGDFYAAYNQSAVIPTGSTTDGTGQDINPTVIDLSTVTTISLISSIAMDVTINFTI